MLLHPGVIRTDLARNYFTTVGRKVAVVLLYPLIYFVTKNVTQGSQTTVYCALENIDKLEGGGYYGDCKKEELKPNSTNEENNERMFK